MSRTIVVRNLPWTVDDIALRKLAESGGRQVESASVKVDRATGRSRGFGFVTFTSEEEAQAALQSLNGLQVESRRIALGEAEDRPSGNPRGSRSSGRSAAHSQANPRSSARGGTGPSRTFIHPYNFVAVPADGLGSAASVHPFRREALLPHDRYDSERFSGYLDCALVSRTHWFIPDPRKCAEEGEHKVFGYFTLDPVDTNLWDKEHPELDATRPAIPAASLRGMVRSVFEAATLSCFAVFDPGTLDYRIGKDPGDKGNQARSGHGAATYVPVRVVRRGQSGTLELQILDGRRAVDPGNTLPVALVHAYEPKVQRRLTRGTTSVAIAGTPTLLWSGLGAIADGTEVAATVNLVAFPKRKSRRNGTSFIAYHFRSATAVVLPGDVSRLRPGSGEVIIFGYIHRTGPNIENKHHERVLFQWAPYNDPGSSETVEDRCKAFLGDSTPSLTADEAGVVTATETGLAGYADRLKNELRRAPKAPRPLGDGAPFPSDFVGTCRIEKRDLLYALVEGGSVVQGLYPVALPRLSHEDERGDLLHHDFHPCEDLDHLCPACRVFGWVRPGPRRAPEPERIDAIAGHVRFSHGVLHGGWGDSPERRATRATLAILGSPKPTTTAFYLEPKVGFDDARETRWPPVLTRAVSSSLPLYRITEAALRGRKLYRRRSRVDPASNDPRQDGILRAPDPALMPDSRPMRDSQNQTVHLLPEQLEFGFRVFFDNLTREELGALVFALTLKTPPEWGNQRDLRHGLGHGKPLGLGAAEVRLDHIHLDELRLASTAHRYMRTPTFENIRSIEASPEEIGWNVRADEFLEAFGAAWATIDREEALGRVRRHLVEMLRAGSFPGPVHYPPHPDDRFDENFEWFKRNRDPSSGPGIRLPDPCEERERADSRLPVNPSERRR